MVTAVTTVGICVGSVVAGFILDAILKTIFCKAGDKYSQPAFVCAFQMCVYKSENTVHPNATPNQAEENKGTPNQAVDKKGTPNQAVDKKGKRTIFVRTAEQTKDIERNDNPKTPKTGWFPLCKCVTLESDTEGDSQDSQCQESCVALQHKNTETEAGNVRQLTFYGYGYDSARGDMTNFQNNCR